MCPSLGVDESVRVWCAADVTDVCVGEVAVADGKSADWLTESVVWWVPVSGVSGACDRVAW